MPKPAPLKLVAEDAAGLEVISAATQDAIGKLTGFHYYKRQRRVTFEFNRFHWESAQGGGPWFRSYSVLGIEGVEAVKARGLARDQNNAVIQLLMMAFEPGDTPAGALILTFADGGEIRVEVECLDVTLYDSNKIWPVRKRPDHDKD